MPNKPELTAACQGEVGSGDMAGEPAALVQSAGVGATQTDLWSSWGGAGGAQSSVPKGVRQKPRSHQQSGSRGVPFPSSPLLCRESGASRPQLGLLSLQLCPAAQTDLCLLACAALTLLSGGFSLMASRAVSDRLSSRHFSVGSCIPRRRLDSLGLGVRFLSARTAHIADAQSLFAAGLCEGGNWQQGQTGREMILDDLFEWWTITPDSCGLSNEQMRG